VAIQEEQASRMFTMESPISHELKVDQSVAHNGVCLTVTAVNGNQHTVCAIEETLSKTTLGAWKSGDRINLERCVQLNARLDGHLVQGHVDSTVQCLEHLAEATQHVYTFALPEHFAALVIEKGSVCLNGISLTCYQVTRSTFQVAIIPYTFEHTTIQEVKVGSFVNIEFDVIGKYVLRMKEIG
jgi:riboflavin synthase